jgi:biopolymer transport protein ExbD
MLKRFRNKRKSGAGDWARAAGPLQAVTMSDIAFVVLVFFIAIAVFSVDERIPTILRAGQTTAGILEFNAYPDGSVLADGTRVGLADVRALVERRLAANHELTVVVVTHPNAGYGVMAGLLDEIERAQCRRISLQSMGD